MSDQDEGIFNSGTPNPSPDASLDNLLASIKNENGEPKYKTVEDALKALGHSQAHIKTLESEKSNVEKEIEQLREQVKKIDSIDEVLKKLTANEEPKKQEEKTTPAGGLSEEAVAKLINNALKAKDERASAENNVNQVLTSLKNKFGDDAKVKEEVAKKAASLGLTPEKLGELSMSAPQLVLQLFEATKPTNTPSPTSSVRLPNVQKPSEVERPEKSVLSGATSREQKEHFLKHKAAVYAKFGIEQ